MTINEGEARSLTKSHMLIEDLGSRDAVIRTEAHKAIVIMGKSAVKPLVKALSSQNKQVRWEAGKILDEANLVWGKYADGKTIDFLVADLSSKDGLVRVRARRALVTIGGKAVASLIKALKSKDDWKRWEAAKTLGQIGDADATEALISALEDEMFDVRWLAAEGLIVIGEKAVVPLLNALIDNPKSTWLREGVHHILHDINPGNLYDILRPVRMAMEDVYAPLDAPIAAEAALKSLTEIFPSNSERTRKLD